MQNIYYWARRPQSQHQKIQIINNVPISSEAAKANQYEWKEMKQMAKAKGINSYGMKKNVLAKELGLV